MTFQKRKKPRVLQLWQIEFNTWTSGTRPTFFIWNSSRFIRNQLRGRNRSSFLRPLDLVVASKSLINKADTRLKITIHDFFSTIKTIEEKISERPC